MSSLDWSRIDGPVTACLRLGDSRRFDTLVEALIYYTRWDQRYAGPRYFLDEFGKIIPAWKVDEVWALNKPAPYRYRDARHHPHVHRQGPVPGLSRRRGGRGRWYRRVRTYQENRENAFLDFDSDAQEHRIKPRGDRRRLPTSWDDISKFGSGNGWKNHRRTQYTGTSGRGGRASRRNVDARHSPAVHGRRNHRSRPTIAATGQS